MFALTPQMEPVERDEAAQSDASIAIEFVVLCFILHGLRIESDIMQGKQIFYLQRNKTTKIHQLCLEFFYIVIYILVWKLIHCPKPPLAILVH